ncbi:MAG: hypothetical protein ACYDEX_21700 [Mobilitalea sp.]
MKEEEIYVKELFHDLFSLDFEKIKETNDKTPDFNIKFNRSIIAVAELKSFISEKPSEDNGWIKNKDGIFQKVSDDNGPARVARKIKEAFKQLKNYPNPKVLVFLNKEPFLDYIDLHECYYGFLGYGSKEELYRNDVSKKIAEGDIKDIKNKIDIYIWIDRIHKNKIYYRYTNEVGKAILEKYFKEET